MNIISRLRTLWVRQAHHKFVASSPPDRSSTRGFTLIETLVALALFTILAYGIYFSYANIVESLTYGQLRIDGTSLIEDELEVVRNMPYQDVGIQGGYPPGKLQAQKTVTVGGNPFILTTTVRNTDDPFDGTAGGNPNDTAPADYKLVELEIRCDLCQSFVPITMTGRVAPAWLETTTNNGSLFITTFDAYGAPVQGATVHVVNSALTPAIDITDTTNISGVLQLVDIPTSTSAYQVTVSKSGYSSEKTYAFGDPQNPNPLTPHATVATQQVTSVSFAIDRTSTLRISAFDDMCVAASSSVFLQSGTKLIGKDPNILKYSTSTALDVQGQKVLSTIEWDTYQFANLTPSYDISGTRPFLPLTINPATTTHLFFTMVPKQPSALLTTVTDANGQPIDGATVILTKTGFSETLTTGRRPLTFTDWSGGTYSSQSGGIADSVPAGALTLLLSASSTYPTSTEWLISSTIDIGTSTDSFYTIAWQPTSEPPQAGAGSLQFQLASNNDNTTWNFAGPDGTAGSFYASSGIALYAGHVNTRYLRYKVFLHTDLETVTPNLSDVTLVFSSSCVPQGQAFFSGLVNDTYTLTIQKSGYQLFTDDAVSVASNWQEYKVSLVSQ